MSTEPPPAPEQPATKTGLPSAPASAGQEGLAALANGGTPASVHATLPEVAAPPVGHYGAVYCRGCGKPVNPQASICVNCGVATGFGLPQRRPANPKSKTTAVVLVVLFALFGWIYTYQRDAWKSVEPRLDRRDARNLGTGGVGMGHHRYGRPAE